MPNGVNSCVWCKTTFSGFGFVKCPKCGLPWKHQCCPVCNHIAVFHDAEYQWYCDYCDLYFDQDDPPVEAPDDF
jgi:primosomal protein N'